MAIKGKAEVLALHRSRFIFACSLRIGGHFYAIKCTRASKPEPRNSGICSKKLLQKVDASKSRGQREKEEEL